MAALTSHRAATLERDNPQYRVPGVAADAVIHAGGQVARNAAGYAVPVTTALGLKGLGVAQETVDNTGGANGAKAVRVKRGVFIFANSGGADEITIADIGNTAYGVDDQTVAKTDATGTRSAIGTIFDVDAKGVWVEYR